LKQLQDQSESLENQYNWRLEESNGKIEHLEAELAERRYEVTRLRDQLEDTNFNLIEEQMKSRDHLESTHQAQS
jgi:hypothetical protein